MSVIAETILFPFMNRMNLTIDSINMVPLNAQNGLFFERRVIRTNNTHPSPFLVALNIRHTVCGCMWVREHAGMCSDIRKSAEGGPHGSSPSHSCRPRGPHRCPHYRTSGCFTAVFGLYLLDTVQKQSTEEIVWATTWQGRGLEVPFSTEEKREVLPCRRQSGCNAGMSQLNVLISNIMGTASGRGFKEWRILKM